jgi:hypothetical protein
MDGGGPCFGRTRVSAPHGIRGTRTSPGGITPAALGVVLRDERWGGELTPDLRPGLSSAAAARLWFGNGVGQGGCGREEHAEVVPEENPRPSRARTGHRVLYERIACVIPCHQAGLTRHGYTARLCRKIIGGSA